MKVYFRKNLFRVIILGVLFGLFAVAAQGMPTQDFFITLLRGLAVGSITFLVASGFSLIFGLLDVLNLAHGTLFMIGAYIGWTVYIRPDTFVDLLTPLLLILSGFLLSEVWVSLSSRIPLDGKLKPILPWLGLLLAGLIVVAVMLRYPIAAWDLENYAQSPGTYSVMVEQGIDMPRPVVAFDKISPLLALIGLLVGSSLGAFSLSLIGRHSQNVTRLTWRSYALFGAAVVLGVAALVGNDAFTGFLNGLGSNGLFLVAMLVAVLSGAGLGALIETTLIRPLYVRPIYQLMLTLGLSAVGIEMVRAIWGRPEFIMPKPALFGGSGEGCPAENLVAALQRNCTTVQFMDGRIRIYNEIFIPLLGLIVLVAVWLLLKRSRLGMIIRAGVQDREMVEALGINVRRVFTMVFALGVGLAALGGVMAAPSQGLSNSMGESFFLNALIALAIGGLTSYPGAALGSVLVGLLQQFIIKYGSIGIQIPFTEVIFKPTPPIVPASTVLLMIVVLLLLPNGLLGKKE